MNISPSRDGNDEKVPIMYSLIIGVGAEAVITCLEVTDEQHWTGTSSVSLGDFAPDAPPVLKSSQSSRVATPRLTPNQIALARNTHMEEFRAGNCPGGIAQVKKCYPKGGPDRRDLVQTHTGLVESRRLSLRLRITTRKARQDLLGQLADDSL